MAPGLEPSADLRPAAGASPHPALLYSCIDAARDGRIVACGTPAGIVYVFERTAVDSAAGGGGTGSDTAAASPGGRPGGGGPAPQRAALWLHQTFVPSFTTAASALGGREKGKAGGGGRRRSGASRGARSKSAVVKSVGVTALKLTADCQVRHRPVRSAHARSPASRPAVVTHRCDDSTSTSTHRHQHRHQHQHPQLLAIGTSDGAVTVVDLDMDGPGSPPAVVLVQDHLHSAPITCLLWYDDGAGEVHAALRNGGGGGGGGGGRGGGQEGEEGEELRLKLRLFCGDARGRVTETRFSIEYTTGGDAADAAADLAYHARVVCDDDTAIVQLDVDAVSLSEDRVVNAGNHSSNAVRRQSGGAWADGGSQRWGADGCQAHALAVSSRARCALFYVPLDHTDSIPLEAQVGHSPSPPTRSTATITTAVAAAAAAAVITTATISALPWTNCNHHRLSPPTRSRWACTESFRAQASGSASTASASTPRVGCKAASGGSTARASHPCGAIHGLSRIARAASRWRAKAMRPRGLAAAAMAAAMVTAGKHRAGRMAQPAAMVMAAAAAWTERAVGAVICWSLSLAISCAPYRSNTAAC